MYEFTDDPLFDGLNVLGEAAEGLAAVMASIEANTPPRDAPRPVVAVYQAKLEQALEEAQRSLSIAAGAMAFHHRRRTVAALVAAAAASPN